MSPAEESRRDAYERPIHVGDIVGGTTSGRYQATIIGPIKKLGKGQVKVLVPNDGGDSTFRPASGAECWISLDRVFLLAPRDDEHPCACRLALPRPPQADPTHTSPTAAPDQETRERR
ncbi:hypothetical protein [Embleya sp. NPDC001921]